MQLQKREMNITDKKWILMSKIARVKNRRGLNMKQLAKEIGISDSSPTFRHVFWFLYEHEAVGFTNLESQEKDNFIRIDKQVIDKILISSPIYQACLDWFKWAQFGGIKK